jgi:hypothetical protein
VEDALITDQEISLLCDVLEGRGADLNADKRKILDQLIAEGFVVAADQESPVKYKLTGKAQQLLAERGVGLSGGQVTSDIALDRTRQLQGRSL